MDKSERIKNEIIISAQELFQRYGLSKTTMNDIAKGAGKGKSTLYYYFQSKEEVFNEVIRKEMDAMFSRINLAVLDAESTDEKLKKYILTKLHMLQEKKNLYSFIMDDISPSMIGEYFDLLHKSYNHREQKLIENILLGGNNDGVFNVDESKISVLSEILISCVRGVEYDILVNGKFKNLENDIDLLINLVMKGMS